MPITSVFSFLKSQYLSSNAINSVGHTKVLQMKLYRKFYSLKRVLTNLKDKTLKQRICLYNQATVFL